MMMRSKGCKLYLKTAPNWPSPIGLSPSSSIEELSINQSLSEGEDVREGEEDVRHSGEGGRRGC